jgi:hypothetical protein
MLVLVAAAGGGVRAQGIFDVGSAKAERAVVTIDAELPELDGKAGSLESPMTRLLRGVLADVQGKGLQEFRTCVPPNPFLGDPSKGERVCVVHLSAAGKTKKVEVVRTGDGNYVAMELEAAGPRPGRAELRRDQFAALLWEWPAYRGGFAEGSLKEPRGEVFALEKPYTAGRFVMDQKTLGDRFLNGSKTEVPATDRVLDQETLFCRLPREYDPRHPAGLVVWVDPTTDGHPPAPFAAALDEGNLICVGAAEAGNHRMVSTREQLAFDGMATVMRRYHVDPRRIYITGVSGGGRVSSMMTVCFPDVFAGAVPIVGLACYENVPQGTGMWFPREFAKPKVEFFRLFKTHRMGAMTGQKDFNQIEIQHAADIYRRDGAQVRVFDFPDMGHSLPTAERFKEALAWVDEPWRAKRAEEEGAAKKAMEAYRERFGAKKPEDESARRMLIKVTEAGAWTEEAWGAAGMLGR